MSNSELPKTLPSLSLQISSIEADLGCIKKSLPLPRGNPLVNCVALTINDSHELIKVGAETVLTYALYTLPVNGKNKTMKCVDSFNWSADNAPQTRTTVY